MDFHLNMMTSLSKFPRIIMMEQSVVLTQYNGPLVLIRSLHSLFAHFFSQLAVELYKKGELSNLCRFHFASDDTYRRLSDSKDLQLHLSNLNFPVHKSLDKFFSPPNFYHHFQRCAFSHFSQMRQYWLNILKSAFIVCLNAFH